MGRWSSDVYEIYCRMSIEAAVRVGTAIGGADVTSLEAGFHREHLELQASEVDSFRGLLLGGDDDGEEDEA